jgi:hypothetical protein
MGCLDRSCARDIRVAAMIISAFIFLIIGFIELIVVQKMIYPSLRWRFERAKVTGSQGVDPSRVMTIIKIQSLLVMPLIGYFTGNPFQKLTG